MAALYLLFSQAVSLALTKRFGSNGKLERLLSRQEGYSVASSSGAGHV
jgi:hypothetical protein